MSTEAPGTAPAPGRDTRLTAVFGCLVVVMGLAALDQTIVATALRAVVSDLGGVNELSWVVTAYLLASTATVPLWGKVGDLRGRKALLQVAVVVFLAGSCLSGAATSIPMLIGARALQGAGAGGLMSLSSALVAQIVPPRERGRYLGYIQMVYTVASVVGPLAGGALVDNAGWRWAFYLNLPLGLAALLGLSVLLRSDDRRSPHSIDYLGAVLLAALVVLIQLVALWGGDTYAWTSGTILALGASAVVTAVLLLVREFRAAEPIIPMGLFRNRSFAAACVTLFVATAGLFAATTFMPLYFQVVRDRSATTSGLLLIPMMVGIALSTTLTGRALSRTGRYKVFPPVGLGLSAAALAWFSRLTITTPWPFVVGSLVLMGLGFGMVSQILMLAVQSTADRKDLGTATATANLFRSLGGALGIAVLGSLFSSGIADRLKGSLPAGADVSGSDVLKRPDSLARFGTDVLTTITHAVEGSLWGVFLVAAAFAVVGVVASLFIVEVPLPARPGLGGPPGGGPGRGQAPGQAPTGAGASADRRTSGVASGDGGAASGREA